MLPQIGVLTVGITPRARLAEFEFFKSASKIKLD